MDDDNNLLGRIYDAALDRDLWPEVLDSLCRMVDCRSGGLMHAQVNTARVTLVGATGLDPSMTDSVPEIFGDPNGNPFLRKLSLLRPGVPISRQALIDDETFERNRIHTDFFGPQDLYHDITTPLILWRDEAVGMFLTRPRSAGPMDENDSRKLLPWIPHLQRALRINRELGMQRAEIYALNELLDRVACGVALVRPDGSIVAMNESAERIAAAADGLAFRNGRIVASSREDSVELTRAIAAAAAGKNGGNLVVRRPSHARGYRIFTMPLSPAIAANWPGAPSSAILIGDPDGAMELPSGALADLYGLSPAETAVAVEAAKGLGLVPVAAKLGISRNTAKTHLSRVFEKTGTNRQAELVRLLLAGPATLPEIPVNSGKLA